MYTIKRTSVFQRWFSQIDSLYQSNNYNTQIELIKNIFKNHLSFSHSYVLCCQNLFDKESSIQKHLDRALKELSVDCFEERIILRSMVGVNNTNEFKSCDKIIKNQYVQSNIHNCFQQFRALFDLQNPIKTLCCTARLLSHFDDEIISDLEKMKIIYFMKSAYQELIPRRRNFNTVSNRKPNSNRKLVFDDD